MAANYREGMARKSPGKTAARVAKKQASGRKMTRAAKSALKSAPKPAAGGRAKAGAKPTSPKPTSPGPTGIKPPTPWTTAEVAEAFRRFRAAQPEPKGELEHVDPYTLLIA